MILYEIDILDLKTGETKRVSSFVGWTQHSPKVYRENMCDCNLGGCRDREVRTMKDGQQSIQAHEMAAYKWRELNGGCDHSMPPTRLKATTAHLMDGRVYDFQKATFEKVAA